MKNIKIFISLFIVTSLMTFFFSCSNSNNSQSQKSEIANNIPEGVDLEFAEMVDDLNITGNGLDASDSDKEKWGKLQDKIFQETDKLQFSNAHYGLNILNRATSHGYRQFYSDARNHVVKKETLYIISLNDSSATQKLSFILNSDYDFSNGFDTMDREELIEILIKTAEASNNTQALEVLKQLK